METNPASRLVALLDRGRGVAGNKKVYEAWAEILDLPDADMGDLVTEIGRVLALPGLIRSEIAELGGDHELYLQHMGNVEQMLFFVPLQGEWGTVVTDLKPEAVYGLRICAERLDRERPEPILDESQLDEIRDAVSDLADFIADADLPDELRTFVLRHLHAIEVALRRVQIEGLEPLNDEFLRLIGDFATNDIIRTQTGSEKDKDGRVKRFVMTALMWIGLIQTAAGTTQKTVLAIEGARQAIAELTTGD